MKAYGVRKKDAGCCPGHDKFPSETYNTRASKIAKKHSDRYAHKRARQEGKRELLKLRND